MSSTTIIDAQPVDLVHADHLLTQRIPKIRAHIPSHRIGEPGKVHVRHLTPGLLPAARVGFLARIGVAR